MRWFVRWSAWIIASYALASAEAPNSGTAAQRIDRAEVGSWEFEAADGSRVRPFAAENGAVNVFVFVSRECPIANRYAPEFRRLHAAFHDRGVRFWFVHPFADEKRAEVAKHARAYSIPGTVLLDPGHRLTRLLGATVTPEAAVIDREFRLSYRGRIDDRFPQLGQERVRPNRSDLREALEAVLAGRPVSEARTRAIGCTIPSTP